MKLNIQIQLEQLHSVILPSFANYKTYDANN